MTGAVLGLAAGGGAAGGVVVPGTLSWTNVFDYGSGLTNFQTLSLITVPISISMSSSGGGAVHYVRNGAAFLYAGPFSVAAGDSLAWMIVNSGLSGVSGTITVRNASDGSATLDAFTYVVKPG